MNSIRVFPGPQNRVWVRPIGPVWNERRMNHPSNRELVWVDFNKHNSNPHCFRLDTAKKSESIKLLRRKPMRKVKTFKSVY